MAQVQPPKSQSAFLGTAESWPDTESSPLCLTGAAFRVWPKLCRTLEDAQAHQWGRVSPNPTTHTCVFPVSDLPTDPSVCAYEADRPTRRLCGQVMVLFGRESADRNELH